MSALLARGLTKRFGRTIGLSAVDLEVDDGASLAVLGPNGAGKSTLLRLCAGLSRPTAGSLEIGGQPAHERAARARVGFIGHASFLYPELTGRENLIFAGRIHGVDNPGSRADALLAEEGLERVAARPVRAYSRGMAQRLAIARGIVHDPTLVLLDEPFTGLDLPSSERLVRRLEAMRSDGRTLVLVTHDVSLATRLADVAIVLRRGAVVHRVSGDALRAEDLERAYATASEGVAT